MSRYAARKKIHRFWGSCVARPSARLEPRDEQPEGGERFNLSFSTKEQEKTAIWRLVLQLSKQFR